MEWGLGGKVFLICGKEYLCCYISEALNDGNKFTSKGDCQQYGLWPPGQEVIACIGNRFGIKDNESPKLWKEILMFLRDGTLPQQCSQQDKLKKFTKQAHQFIHHDGQL